MRKIKTNNLSDGKWLPPSTRWPAPVSAGWARGSSDPRRGIRIVVTDLDLDLATGGPGAAELSVAVLVIKTSPPRQAEP